jgi:hypothetical protein
VNVFSVHVHLQLDRERGVLEVMKKSTHAKLPGLNVTLTRKTPWERLRYNKEERY